MVAKKLTPQVPGAQAAAASEATDTTTERKWEEGRDEAGQVIEGEATVLTEVKGKPAAGRTGGLPRPEDVDPAKIHRAVLTTEGYVCPLEAPKGRG